MFSSHGCFLDTEGQVALASQIQSDSATDQSSVIASNPLRSFGLLLANANSHTSVDLLTHDGVVTGVEIAGTNLRGTILAMLSDCETGVGTLNATGGAIGLRGAFHEAGAQCVVGPLWVVPDLATAELMESFFGHLAINRDVQSAMQAAQRHAIQTRRTKHGAAHPIDWAAFSVSGHSDLAK